MQAQYVAPYAPHPTCPCRTRQYVPAVPVAWVPPLSVGRYYTPPIPSYPIIRAPFTGEQLYTPGPSYLNAISNDRTHPLWFMSMNNTQRF